jgi:hypothetical protein
MPPKAGPHFGALPNSCKRLTCDFSRMRGVRAQPVSIRHIALPDVPAPPGYSWRSIRNFTRDSHRKDPIRSFLAGSRRGVAGKNQASTRPRRAILRTVSRRLSSRGGAAPAEFSAHFRRVASDFVLLYLTLVAIFDNRHPLLKKFEVGGRRNPCRPRNHVCKC